MSQKMIVEKRETKAFKTKAHPDLSWQFTPNPMRELEWTGYQFVEMIGARIYMFWCD